MFMSAPKYLLKHTVAAGCFSLLLVAPTMAQTADQQRMERLEAMVEQLQDALTRTRSEISAIKKMQQEQAKEREKDYTLVSKGGGFHFQDKKGNSFKLGGRIQLDQTFYDDLYETEGRSVAKGEFRRMRLSGSGSVQKDWKYKIVVDIDDADAGASIDDGYIQYVGFKPLAITVGKFKEPFSLEQLTSSKWISTQERNMILNALPGALAVGQPDFAGVALSGYHKDFHHFNWSFGVFDDMIEDNDGSGDREYAFTGRVAAAPNLGEDQVLHLGVAYSIRDLQGEPQRVRSRFGVHTADWRVLGNSPGIDDVDQLGLELAYQYKAFTLQGEYYDINMDGTGKNANAAGDASGDAYGNDLDVDGYYVQASYTLTGEKRTYKHKGAAFDKVTPKGKWGAWELVARYENMEVDSNETVNSSDRTESLGELDVDKYVVGVNWYFNNNVKFMANYIHAEVDDYSGTRYDDANGGDFSAPVDDGDGLTFRLQYAW